METAKLARTETPLRYGLLADQVLHISHVKKNLTPEDQRILLHLKTLVELSEDGMNQVITGKIMANAIDAIAAYQTILASLPPYPPNKTDALSKMLSKVKAEIESILKDGQISPATSGKIRWLSKNIRKSSIRIVGKVLILT